MYKYHFVSERVDLDAVMDRFYRAACNADAV